MKPNANLTLIHADLGQPGSRTAHDEIYNTTVTGHETILTLLTFIAIVFIGLGTLSADQPVLLVYVKNPQRGSVWR